MGKEAAILTLCSDEKLQFSQRRGTDGNYSSMQEKNMTRKGWLLFLAISLFWGIPYLFIKIAVRELDPTVVVFARAGIGAAVLLPIAAQRKMLPQLRKYWLILILFSCVAGWRSSGLQVSASMGYA